MGNPYLPVKAVVEKVINETPQIKTFVFRPEHPIEFKTGQFVNVTIPGVGEAPFTPSSDPEVKDVMEITIMKAGVVTEKIHSLKVGDKVGIRGPLGKGYPLSKFKGKDIYVIGGGVGMAPLRSLLYELFNNIDDYNKIVIRFGSKTPADISYKHLIPEWQKKDKVEIKLTVDNGDNSWKSNVGVVTTILDKKDVDIKNSVAVVCGPPIMMKFATMELFKMGFDGGNIYLSMEKNMSCGIGKCGHCRLGDKYCCEDGPVFPYSEIKDFEGIWD